MGHAYPVLRAPTDSTASTSCVYHALLPTPLPLPLLFLLTTALCVSVFVKCVFVKGWGGRWVRGMKAPTGSTVLTSWVCHSHALLPTQLPLPLLFLLTTVLCVSVFVKCVFVRGWGRGWVRGMKVPKSSTALTRCVCHSGAILPTPLPLSLLFHLTTVCECLCPLFWLCLVVQFGERYVLAMMHGTSCVCREKRERPCFTSQSTRYFQYFLVRCKLFLFSSFFF